MVPYNREIADQRRKYGDIMLRKSEEHLAAQRQFEAEAQAKLESARQKRQEERDRQEALEVRSQHLYEIHFDTSVPPYSKSAWKHYESRRRY
jgi:hypothetical protein